MINQDHLIEPCREALAAGLATASPDLVDCIVAHLCGEASDRPVEAALTELLGSGDEGLVSGFMVALLRCQQRHLELIFPELATLTVEQQVETMKGMFGRYAYLQQTWMSMVQQRHTEMVAALHHEIEEERAKVAIERTKTRWLRERQIKLYNYFRELQVAVVADVVDVTDERVTIRVTPKVGRVFAAGENRHWAYTPTADPGLSLRVIPESRDGDRVTLRVGGVTEHRQEKRRHLRLSLRDSTPVAVEHDGRPVGEAQVLDFSQRGLELRFNGDVKLEVGDAVVCRGVLTAHHRSARIDADGTVRWVGTEDGATRLGVELKTSSHEEELLAVIRAHEQRAIQDLRKLEVPEVLRE